MPPCAQVTHTQRERDRDRGRNSDKAKVKDRDRGTDRQMIHTETDRQIDR